jgi:C4-type Zn-finger protein
MEQVIKCPICGNDCHLKMEKREFIPYSKNYSLEGEWFFYRCNDCDENFTTTESDANSMRNLKQRNL